MSFQSMCIVFTLNVFMSYVSLSHFPAISSQGINIHLAFRYLFLDKLHYGEYLSFCLFLSILCKFPPNRLKSPVQTRSWRVKFNLNPS